MLRNDWPEGHFKVCLSNVLHLFFGLGFRVFALVFGFKFVRWFHGYENNCLDSVYS